MASTRPPVNTATFPKAVGGRPAPAPAWLRSSAVPALRVRLFEAGVDLIGRTGRFAPTVDDVLRVAGVSRGTFYNHFDDMFSFMQFLFDEVQIRLSLAIERANVSISDPVERLARVVVVCMEYAELYPNEVQILARFNRAQMAADSPLSLKFGEELITALVTGRARECSLEAAVCVFVGTTSTAMFVIANSRPSGGSSGLASEVTCALLNACGVEDLWMGS